MPINQKYAYDPIFSEAMEWIEGENDNEEKESWRQQAAGMATHAKMSRRAGPTYQGDQEFNNTKALA